MSLMIKVIAEVGSNFNGSLELALEYVRKAAECGAYAVKFQCWRAEDLFSEKHPAYSSVKEKPVGFPLEWHKEVKKEAEKNSIKLATTPTQPYQIEHLEEAGVDIYKIASGDINFFPLLEEVARTKKTVVLSTGMSSIEEVERAVEKLSGCKKIVILHCVSLYPPEPHEMNLRALEILKENFPHCEVGFSDHTEGFEASILALSLGASWFEKHITFDKNLPTPDAPFALSMSDFKKFIQVLEKAQKMMGEKRKYPTEREFPERFWARRGLYAACDIREGDRITRENTVFLRPCMGIPPDWEFVFGKRARRFIKKGEPISLLDLK